MNVINMVRKGTNVEYPLWEKEVKRLARPVEGKAHQRERRVRRVEEEEAVCVTKPREVQQEKERTWRRSPVHVL